MHSIPLELELKSESNVSRSDMLYVWYNSSGQPTSVHCVRQLLSVHSPTAIWPGLGGSGDAHRLLDGCPAELATRCLSRNEVPSDPLKN